MNASYEGPALHLDNVVKTYGDVPAVTGLSMSVQVGTVLAFLGPNGAGKTTTIEMCEGFIKPTSGRISVLGMDPATSPERVRERIGIMLQGGGGYSGLSVAGMLKLAASYSRNPHDSEWLIDILGLDGIRKTSYRRLSGGQQQRLSLALALISRPELVFLDEPTAGMDAQSRHMVWDLISALRADGVTVVLTTHLMDEAEALADHVVIINKGKVIADGTPAELTAVTRPRIAFETNHPFDTQALGSIELTKVRPLHYQVEAEASPQIIADIAAAAATQNVLIRSLAVDHQNLEDAFLDLTGHELRS